jgi:hypothetical protein
MVTLGGQFRAGEQVRSHVRGCHRRDLRRGADWPRSNSFACTIRYGFFHSWPSVMERYLAGWQAQCDCLVWTSRRRWLSASWWAVSTKRSDCRTEQVGCNSEHAIHAILKLTANSRLAICQDRGQATLPRWRGALLPLTPLVLGWACAVFFQ